MLFHFVGDGATTGAADVVVGFAVFLTSSNTVPSSSSSVGTSYDAGYSPKTKEL